MTTNTKSILFLLCLALIVQTLSFSGCFHPFSVIKTVPDGLALTCEKTGCVVKNFTQSRKQLWRLQPQCDGSYLICSTNRCILDVGGGIQKGHNVTISMNYRKNETQWFINSNGTIVNAAIRTLALDVKVTTVIVEALRYESQQFQLSCFCCNICWYRHADCCC